jgi:hypothetical protein
MSGTAGIGGLAAPRHQPSIIIEIAFLLVRFKMPFVRHGKGLAMHGVICVKQVFCFYDVFTWKQHGYNDFFS